MKLTRNEQISLEMVRDNLALQIDSGTRDKLVMLGLVNTINLNQACQYSISQNGSDYLEAHPTLPPLRLSDTSAKLIYRMLGDASYDCAPSYVESSSAFGTLIFTRAVKPEDEKNRPILYTLTDEGRAAFEATPIGQGYLMRRKEIELREAIDLAFGDLDTTQTSAQLREKAALAREKGSELYALELEQRASAAEAVKQFRQKYLSDLSDATDVKIQFAKDRLLVARIVFSHSVNVECLNNQWIGERQAYADVFIGWRVGANKYIPFNVNDDPNRRNAALDDRDIQKNLGSASDYANQLLTAVALAERLNQDRYGYPE